MKVNVWNGSCWARKTSFDFRMRRWWQNWVRSVAAEWVVMTKYWVGQFFCVAYILWTFFRLCLYIMNWKLQYKVPTLEIHWIGLARISSPHAVTVASWFGWLFGGPVHVWIVANWLVRSRWKFLHCCHAVHLLFTSQWNVAIMLMMSTMYSS